LRRLPSPIGIGRTPGCKARGKGIELAGMNNIPYDSKTRPQNGFHDIAATSLGKISNRVTGPEGTGPEKAMTHGKAETHVPQEPMDDTGPCRSIVRHYRFSERYRELFDSAPMACVSLDEKGRIKEANRSAALMFGLRQEHLINLPLVNFLDWGDRPAFMEFLKSITSETPHRIEMRLLFGNNPNTWVHVVGTLGIDPQDRFAELRLALIDITERKKQEQRLAEEARALGTEHFAANIAHVLNNRMSTVLGYADLLKHAITHDANALRMVSNIAQAAQMVGELADLIVAYACPGRSGADEADLPEIIASVLQSQPAPRGIHTVSDLASDLWKIKIDPRQLRTVVANLFINACEAIGTEGRIRITARNLDKTSSDPAYVPEIGSGAFVRMTVQDTGCGIQPESLGRIFEPFYSTKFMGRGMGLAAVQGIVKGCGGHIEVASAPCCTNFSIYLPAVKGSAKESQDGNSGF